MFYFFTKTCFLVNNTITITGISYIRSITDGEICKIICKFVPVFVLKIDFKVRWCIRDRWCNYTSFQRRTLQSNNCCYFCVIVRIQLLITRHIPMEDNLNHASLPRDINCCSPRKFHYDYVCIREKFLVPWKRITLSTKIWNWRKK